MDLKEKIETIPKEIYDDIQEVCEKTFLKGRTVYAEELIPKRILKNKEIWEIFREEKDATYTISDLQTYLALEKMVKKDKKTISEVIGELYKEWETNEEFFERRLTVMHNVAKYYPKEFNKEILYSTLKKFINDIKKQNRLSIAESYIKNTYMEFNIIINHNDIGCSSFVNNFMPDILEYIGQDIIERINNVDFKKYDIILKNKNFSNGKEDWKIDEDDIVINLDEFSNNSYLVEILDDLGFIDEINSDYINLQKLMVSINENLEKDFWLYFEQQ